MKGFLGQLQKDFQGLGKKKQSNNRGGGQSLGGSKPGVIIPVSIAAPGSIGVQLENTREGSAIIAKVTDGSSAALAGLKRGDVICHSQTDGKNEMLYRQFLDLCRSDQRPLIFDVRRVESSVAVGKGDNMRADNYARRKAVMAAALARDEQNKLKKKPISKSKELSMEEKQKIQQQRMENEKKNASVCHEPKTHEAREAVRIAKKDEAKHVQELGYNPYEAARSTGKQGANATVSVKHGSIEAGSLNSGTPNSTSAGNSKSSKTNNPKQSVSTTTSSSTTSLPHPNDLTPIDTEFDEAFVTIITHNQSSPPEKLSKSLRIMNKLILNAITEGQTDDKKRMVRISNPNKLIQAAINDLDGAIQLMLSVGFTIGEYEDSETYLMFPPGDTGPPWLSDALDRMEQYEKGL